MISKEKKLKPKEGTSILLDLITNKIVKISTLVGALVAIVTGAFTIIDKFSSTKEEIAKTELSKPSSLSNCFKRGVLLAEPKEVPFSQFKDVKLTLKGENTCKEQIHAYVTFASKKGSLIIEPTIEPDPPVACDDPENWKKCWQPITLGDSLTEREVLPPQLRLNADTLEHPEDVKIIWTIETRDQTMIDSDVAHITVTGDPKPLKPGAPR